MSTEDTATDPPPHPWLRPGRRAAVLAAVGDLHGRAERDGAGKLRVPVDVHGLAGELGLRVIAVHGLAGQRTPNLHGTPISGLLDFWRGRIYVEERNTIERQRFTVAHELGHYVLEHRELLGDVHADVKIAYGLGSYEATGDRVQIAEAEANRFAGLLLIPPDELDAHVAELGPDVVELARRFQVSAPAMRVHLSRYLHPPLKRERTA